MLLRQIAKLSLRRGGSASAGNRSGFHFWLFFGIVSLLPFSTSANCSSTARSGFPRGVTAALSCQGFEWHYGDRVKATTGHLILNATVQNANNRDIPKLGASEYLLTAIVSKTEERYV